MAQCSEAREVCGCFNSPKLCCIQPMTSSLYRSSGCSSMYFFIYQQETWALRFCSTRKSMAACKKMHCKDQNICNWFDVPLITLLNPVLVRALLQRLGPWMSLVRRWTWGLPPSPRWTCSEALHSHWTLWTENSQDYTPGSNSEGLKEDVQESRTFWNESVYWIP